MNEPDHDLTPLSASRDPGDPAEAPSRWLAFVAAVQFLTRIHLSSGESHASSAVGRCPVFFPLVGALLGIMAAASTGLGALVWPPWLAVLAALALEAWLTGALHEDAVADFCDAFGGGHTRDRVLTILEDSRIGAFGALGLLLAFSLRAGAMMTLIARWGLAGWPLWSSAFVASAATGRWVMVLAMGLLPPIAGRESLARDRWQPLTPGSVREQFVGGRGGHSVCRAPASSISGRCRAPFRCRGRTHSPGAAQAGRHDGGLPRLCRIRRPGCRAVGDRRQETTVGPALMRCGLTS